MLLLVVGGGDGDVTCWLMVGFELFGFCFFGF